MYLLRSYNSGMYISCDYTNIFQAPAADPVIFFLNLWTLGEVFWLKLRKPFVRRFPSPLYSSTIMYSSIDIVDGEYSMNKESSQKTHYSFVVLSCGIISANNAWILSCKIEMMNKSLQFSHSNPAVDALQTMQTARMVQACHYSQVGNHFYTQKYCKNGKLYYSICSIERCISVG